MPVFHLAITDGGNAEMDIECATAREAVSGALRALSDFVAERPALPGDISITVKNAERSLVAVVAVTFTTGQGKSSAH